MSKRILAIALSIIGSGVVLFGGWFFYERYLLEKPMQIFMEQFPSIKAVETEFTSREAKVTLKLSDDANLKDIVHSIIGEGKKWYGHREVKINIENNTSPKLEKIWSQALFDVAGAMETQNYALIPESLEKISDNVNDVDVHAEIDDQYVYVQLKDSTSSKYVMLPRLPQKIEVWSHA